MARHHQPRWKIALQADIPSIQTWSIRCGLQLLAHRNEIELRHMARELPAGPGVWLEVTDRTTSDNRSIHIDIGDRADPASKRMQAADTSWARCPVPGSGRPLGLLAPMRTRGQNGTRYLSNAAWAAVRNRRFRHLWAVQHSLRTFRPPLIDSLELDAGGDAKVLYQVTAWNPAESADSAGREWLNDRRAALVVALREAFGDRFVGGFVPTEHALHRYPELVTNFPSGRLEYLDLIRQCRVVVSGVGLHGSNPWKLAEYLAASRAIVAEPLQSEIPESLDPVVHWFEQPEQCVGICERLLSDQTATAEHQRKAGEYWRRYVRPDQLLMNRLQEEFASTPFRHLHDGKQE